MEHGQTLPRFDRIKIVQKNHMALYPELVFELEDLKSKNTFVGKLWHILQFYFKLATKFIPLFIKISKYGCYLSNH